jgi:hypothetical protein
MDKDLDSGPMKPAGNGSLRSQVVLREVGGVEPFVTHLRVFRGDGSFFHTWGHYFKSEAAAREDFQKRVERGY